MTFSRSRYASFYDYALDGQSLVRKQCVKDLGVLLDTKLSFKDHLDHVIASRSRVLGLVIYMTRKHVARLESIQRKITQTRCLLPGLPRVRRANTESQAVVHRGISRRPY